MRQGRNTNREESRKRNSQVAEVYVFDLAITSVGPSDAFAAGSAGEP